MNNRKDINYYMDLPYVIEMWKDEDGDWIVRIPLLEGLLTHGSTQIEALDMLEDAKRGWFEVSLEMGGEIPEPSPQQI